MQNFPGYPWYDKQWAEQLAKQAEARQLEMERRMVQMANQYRAQEQSRDEFRKSVADEVVKAIGPLIRLETRLAAKFIVDEIMATKVKATIKDGKVKPKDTAPTHVKIARKGKADTVEKGLRKNREASRARSK